MTCISLAEITRVGSIMSPLNLSSWRIPYRAGNRFWASERMLQSFPYVGIDCSTCTSDGRRLPQIHVPPSPSYPPQCRAGRSAPFSFMFSIDLRRVERATMIAASVTHSQLRRFNRDTASLAFDGRLSHGSVLLVATRLGRSNRHRDLAVTTSWFFVRTFPKTPSEGWQTKRRTALVLIALLASLFPIP